MAVSCLMPLPVRKAALPRFEHVFNDSFTSMKEQIRSERSMDEFRAMFGLWCLLDQDLGLCLKIAAESFVRLVSLQCCRPLSASAGLATPCDCLLSCSPSP